MGRYLLTPPGRVANLMLAAILLLAFVAALLLALAEGGLSWVAAGTAIVLMLGVLMHFPPTYGAAALVALIGLAASLNLGDVVAVLANALVVGLALYARSQLHERVVSSSPDGGAA
jgi:hypothetical protein